MEMQFASSKNHFSIWLENLGHRVSVRVECPEFHDEALNRGYKKEQSQALMEKKDKTQGSSPSSQFIGW